MKRNLLVSLTLVLALSGLAALSRYQLATVLSRHQIAAFAVAAVSVELLIKPRLGIRPSWLMAIATTACTTAAIIATRWSMKGLCPHTWPRCPDPIAAAQSRLIAFVTSFLTS